MNFLLIVVKTLGGWYPIAISQTLREQLNYLDMTKHIFGCLALLCGVETQVVGFTTTQLSLPPPLYNFSVISKCKMCHTPCLLICLFLSIVKRANQTSSNDVHAKIWYEPQNQITNNASVIAIVTVDMGSHNICSCVGFPSFLLYGTLGAVPLSLRRF